VELYDSLGGPDWPKTFSQGCDGRLDPCGCAASWQKSIKCQGLRDYKSITELYLLGPDVKGEIPASISAFTQLQALSLVETKIQGTLPGSIADLQKLTYLWLDHNPMLGGELPSTLAKMGQLYAFEVHYSNFTGTLPKANWRGIADCALQGNRFACPLPPGAETCGASCA